MTEQAITLHLPGYLYQQLVEVANASQQTLDSVVLQSIRSDLPPSLAQVPDRFRADLRALNRLSDETLWQIARSDLDDDKAVLYKTLLEQNQRGELNKTDQTKLSNLRKDADLLMLHRSYAYALKWRGHRIPSLGELQNL